MLNLNMGAGTSRAQGYISIDYYAPEADLALDITKPLPWGDGEVDNIYSSHCIEHFSRAEWERIRKEWSRILKHGGTIEIRCPDIGKVCRRFIDRPDDSFVMMQLYGLQSNDGEYHKNGFTKESLAASFPGFRADILSPSTDTELHMRFIKDV